MSDDLTAIPEDAPVLTWNEKLIAWGREHAETLVNVLPNGVGNTLTGLADALEAAEAELTTLRNKE